MSRQYTREDAMSIPEPEFTETWKPVSHATVIESIDNAVAELNMKRVAERYTLTKEGKNMFATYSLEGQYRGRKDYGIQIGFRNSIEKRFSIGICAGTKVIACSNLCFSGKFIDFRKHTKNLNDDELDKIALSSTEQAVNESKDLIKWQESLKKIKIGYSGFKEITFEAMQREILRPSSFKNFLDCFEEERGSTIDQKISLFHFHASATRLFKPLGLFSLSKHTNGLNDMCQEYVEATKQAV